MGRTIAKVAVAKAIYAIDKPYDYRVPEELVPRLRTGMRVLVPFAAGNRGSDGIVLSVQEAPSAGPPLKSVTAVLDEEPVLDEHHIQLALWMRERCFCTVYDCVKAMLPAGLYFSLRDCVKIQPGIDREQSHALAGDSPAALRLLELLWSWGGEGTMEQIRLAFGTRDPGPALRRLKEAGAVSVETAAQRAVGDKTQKLAVLAVSAEDAMAMVSAKRRSAPLQYAVTELLCTLGAASAKELCYYTGASMATVRALERHGVLTLEKQEVLRSVPLTEVAPAPPPVLNEEQQAAFEGLDALARQEGPAAALLYGVTGSGKTQVYIRLIQQTLSRGKSALVLVPEIVLTPQLLRIFAAHFGQQVAVLHSSLRVGERYDEWKRVRRGEARVVIGTRSAVFAPLSDPGLIILDEEQESSYKSENVPRYHARDVAKYRCVQHNALLVLGSATPSVETMYQAQTGQIGLFQLKHRYNQKSLPQVLIVDLKEELRQGNAGSISSVLRRELEENFRRQEQAILFLNRRGANRMVSCGECGEVPECPRCSVKLTYHSANHRLMCHHCGFSRPLPPACPVCGGLLNFVGTGTQQVESELRELFPREEVLRMDADTISAANPHEKLLERFQKQRIPVLIGTQMVAKGLDFENVTLVGVVAPDLSLYVDDFRAGERTFSLLTQVAGRAGRGEKQGRAVIQTFTPNNDVIRCAAAQDYDSFYAQEIELRRTRRDPPFAQHIVVTASGLEEGAVLRCCTRLRRALEEELPKLPGQWQLLGPAPASVAKVNNRYRYRLTLTGQPGREFRTLLAYLLRAAHKDKDNKGVSVYADTDPYSS
ncbi:primosomal protein N' [Pseudoflavonifractor sp. 60]|uniref:replication restart helicase PriA n=1 Tax=Pseudoflavonifractor sp. 60 TaxID=2304576 RepID=UPI001369881B|nr:primosomal protein N' [Pseudoflavonifractor sp. 60]NBI66903.1 primosomal protein N' [Pseudoflavonifractor sp. 60]